MRSVPVFHMLFPKGEIYDTCVDATADELPRLTTTEEKPTVEREKVQLEAQPFSLVVQFKKDGRAPLRPH